MNKKKIKAKASDQKQATSKHMRKVAELDKMDYLEVEIMEEDVDEVERDIFCQRL